MQSVSLRDYRIPALPANPPSAAECRSLARENLLAQGTKPNSVTADLLELTALQLYETYVETHPTQFPSAGPVSPPTDPNALTGAITYVRGLSAAAGLTGPLAPALHATLNDFDGSHIWQVRDKSKPGTRDLGSCNLAAQAAPASVPSYMARIGSRELLVTGNLNAEQKQQVTAMLEDLVNKVGEEALKPLTALHFRSLLGTMQSSPGKGTSTVGMVKTELGLPRLPDDGRAAGMANPVDKSIHLEYRCLEHPRVASQTIYHELGHIKDFERRDKWSSSFDRWTRSVAPGDYESTYAEVGGMEDRAESNAVLLAHWDRIQACPQMWVHSDGQRGEKLGWLMKKFYHLDVPGKARAVRDAERQVRAGQTPFADEAEYRKTMRAVLSVWSPGEPVPNLWGTQRRFIVDVAQRAQAEEQHHWWQIF